MKALATILLPLLTLLMLESCSRALFTLREDIASHSVLHTVASRELGWERRPNYRGLLPNSPASGIREYDADGFAACDTAQIRDRNTPRILAIGDSTTYGWGVPEESSFVEVLDRALPNASVINLALVGYSSFQGYRMLVKHGERLQPSLIIASFSYNDRRHVHDGDVDSEQKFARYAERARGASHFAWLDYVYTARLLRWLLRTTHLTRANPPLRRQVLDLAPRVSPESYRSNLRLIAQYGRARNVPVIFLLLQDNLLYTARIRAGLEYRRRGEYAGAINAFTAGLANPLSGTLARKHLVQVLEETGAHQTAAALGGIEVSSEIDGGHPIELDAEYNRIMIEVARERGVKLVDARPILDANPEAYLDMCHPDAVGHALIAELLFQAIKEVAPALVRGAAEPIVDETLHRLH